MRTRKRTTDGVWGKLRPVVIGVAVTVLAGAVCFMLTALLMTFVDISPTVQTVLSVFAVAVASFVGGFTAARIAGKDGWLQGLLVGAVLFVLLLITGLLLYRDIRIGFLFVKLAALLLCGMAGGMVGIR